MIKYIKIQLLKYNCHKLTVNFQTVKLVLEKEEEPEIRLPTSAGSSKKQESTRKTFISALLTSLDCVDHNKLWKILEEMGIPDT